ncbi:hypothetical protein [Pedobacter nototheniae]|uniref:hypothetical protein n=1 Tax=Pedobacter nototheniae TaxID=2488994 RepID=UPI00292E04FE|nr:hypothetical protein [Pedobacter nototheniae]
MKKLKYLVVIFSLLAIPFAGKSQTGCLVPTGDVYTVPEGSLVNAILGLLVGPGYKGSPSPSSTVCVNNTMTTYIPDNSKNCRVCTGGGFTIVIAGVLVTCGTTLIDGKVATATIIGCSLDDYSWTLSLAAGIFGFVLIRRRVKF